MPLAVTFDGPEHQRIGRNGQDQTHHHSAQKSGQGEIPTQAEKLLRGGPELPLSRMVGHRPYPGRELGVGAKIPTEQKRAHHVIQPVDRDQGERVRNVDHDDSREPVRSHQGVNHENEKHLDTEKGIACVYTGQAVRRRCKNCDALLPGGFDFVEMETEYVFCERCGHLNGRYEDSDAFCRYVYHDDAGERYGFNYTAADREAYFERMRSIYLPKATFLLDVLAAEKRDPQSLTVMDFGAGSGYFVAALAASGVDATGYEISGAQVAFGNAMLEGTPLRAFPPDDTVRVIEGIESTVLSMIGVLEHLQNPREIKKKLVGKGW